MPEGWKPIKGYEDLYLVSNYGMVKNRITYRIADCCRGTRKSTGGFRWSYRKKVPDE